jgi:putative hemolysin
MEILILGLLIIFNGFFALSEISLVSSKKSRLEKARIEGRNGAKIALKLKDDSGNFLSAVQVGMTLIGIVTGVYGGINVADHITPFFQQFDSLRPYSAEISLTLAVVVITYVSIVIGELVPKTIAMSNPEKVAIRIAPVIYYFSRILYPFVKLLSASTNFVTKMLGIKKISTQLTEAELRQMIKLASYEGVIEKEQNIIHENVFYFSDKKAQHVMTHRTDVEWIDLNKSKEAIKEELLALHHSKVICCRENLDNFVGVLYLKDYYKALSASDDVKIADLLIEPIIVPERTDAQKVLNRLRQNESHVCFVVNEYGGFEGIITLYDIMENLVGQIPEEGESEDPDVFVRDDNSVLVSGDAPVETLVEIIEDFTIDFGKIDYSTVAGFVLNQVNRIPKVGDKFQYKNYAIEIVDIDGNRIDKVLIKKDEHK